LFAVCAALSLASAEAAPPRKTTTLINAVIRAPSRGVRRRTFDMVLPPEIKRGSRPPRAHAWIVREFNQKTQSHEADMP
jgi:hypothetical protein